MVSLLVANPRKLVCVRPAGVFDPLTGLECEHVSALNKSLFSGLQEKKPINLQGSEECGLVGQRGFVKRRPSRPLSFCRTSVEYHT